MSKYYQLFCFHTLILSISLIIMFNHNFILSNKLDLDSKSLVPDVLEKLYNLCKEQNYHFCSMTEAVKYTFSSKIFEESIDYPNETCYSCLKYTNVLTKNMECGDANIEEKSFSTEKEKYYVSLINCTINFTGILSYGDTSESFSSEIHFDEINFSQNKRSTKGELNISFEYDVNYTDAFNYDKKDPIFSKGVNLTDQMDSILKEIIIDFINKSETNIVISENQMHDQINYLKEVLNKFEKQFSIFHLKIEEDNNNITYTAYGNIQYSSLVNINNTIFIPNLTIDFEYALNYNITYNEGKFQIENVTFSNIDESDYLGDIVNKSADFEDIVTKEESSLIWEIIEDDFKNCFKNNK